MRRGQRRTIVAGLVLAGWTIGQATLGVAPSSAAGTLVVATPTMAGAASAATPTANNAAKVATPTIVAARATTTTAPVARGGADAPWLRFGLILMLGLALGGGATVQYRATADAPPYQPKPRRPRGAAPRLDLAPQPQSSPMTSVATGHASAPVPTPPTPDTRVPTAPGTVERTPVFSAFPRGKQLEATPVPQPYPRSLRMIEQPPRLSRAEGCCAQAIAAAYRYDRPGTLAAFGEALDADPTLKPSALPDFWEMPAGGHADLALAYLQREQRLDARSVVTMALLTFPHNRELTALLREIDPYRLDRPA